MRKFLAICLAAVLMVGCVPALAQEAQPTKLVIGSGTKMSGAFFTDLWGNNASDMDVRGLIHGYSTVAWLKSGEYALDQTVATSLNTSVSNLGQKIYAFTLSDQLKWNDGTPITAKDYVFSVLLQSSPQIAALGVSNEGMSYLIGQPEFASGETAVFAGVRLVDDHSFTLLVDDAYLPYFYELMLVNITPYPMDVLAPGVDIADDGDGAYFTGDFTEQLLRQTILGDAGYLRTPAKTCGAYTLVSYDEAAGVAQFEKNPYYQGNFEGQKPEMEALEFRYIPTSDMLAALQNGEVDILNKVADGTAITQALALQQAGTVNTVNYVRAGFGFLAYACEDTVTSDVAVRKAIAMCVDTDVLCQEVFQGYALPVYGYYGMGQWMASVDSEQLNELNVYGYDPEGAAQLLVDAGWTMNEQGAEFVPGTDTVRYKNIAGTLTPLTIRWGKTNGATSVVLERMLGEAATALGLQLEVTELTFPEALACYYRQTERTYNLFNLSTNFSHVFDPYYTYQTGDAYQGVYNTSGLQDDQLMKLAGEMRAVETGDTTSYYEKWFAFQQRWGEELPMVPLYSNVYFDFFRPDLYGYDINTDWGWSASILYATFTQPLDTADGVAVEQP